MAAEDINGVFRLEDRSDRWGVKLWTVTFDLPGEKVNKLGQVAMDAFGALMDRLETLASEGRVEAVAMLSGKPGNFIAGADINLIQSAKSAEDAERLSTVGQNLLNRWEDMPFPTVVGIDGAALGGGCELSLASTAIVMSDSDKARIGLPEVMLGIIPGMGGCVRLPVRIGIAGALDMILTGKNLDGKRAHKMGLADAMVPKENFAESVQAWTVKNLKALKAGQRLAKEPKLGGVGGAMGSALEKTPMGRSVIFKKARQGVLSKTRGQYPAPLEAIEVVRSTGTGYGKKLRGKAREKALAREAEGFGKCAATEVSRNLIRLFFLTEQVKKSNGLEAGSTAKAHSVQFASVLGAGVMGGGIAQLFADRGVPTRMKDINKGALETGIQSANKLFKKKLKTRRISQREYLQKMNLIAPTLSFEGFESTDLVVEAVIEKMDIKKAVLKELETHVHEDCVIASNTSSLSITEMQSVMAHPERFVGMHFFNPVHRMPLIEVIRGEKTNDEAVATIFEFSKKMGKTPIVVKDAPGFLVNRLLMPYLNEATYLLADGVPVPEIDKAMLDFGMPMGPMELIDEVGVDVGEKVANILFDAFGERMTPSPMHGKVAGANRLGKKNGKGIYNYDPDPKKKDRYNKRLDPEIYKLLGLTPQSGAVPREDIIDRCVLPMINEASRCLDEGIVASPSEVDLGMIMGTGFPPFRGGLLRYADSLGAKRIVDRLRTFEKRFGARFAPAPGLLKRAEHDQPFYTS